MSLKKKAIRLVIDTDLTDEEIERGFEQELRFYYHGDRMMLRELYECRNVRVLDSDEIKEREDA